MLTDPDLFLNDEARSFTLGVRDFKTPIDSLRFKLNVLDFVEIEGMGDAVSVGIAGTWRSK